VGGIITMTDNYIRLLTKEEAKQIDIEKLEFHEWIEETFDTDQDNFNAIYDDIHENGMKKPIVLFEKKLLDGRVRWAVIVGEDINFDIPFAEFIGSREEAKEWLRRENDVRVHQKLTALVVRALEEWIPYFENKKKLAKANKTSLLESEKGEVVKLAAGKMGIGKDSVRKGNRIKKDCQEIYTYMKQGLITLEQAYKVFDKRENWSLPWLERVLSQMSHDNNSLVKALKEAKQQFIEELEMKKFQKANAEYGVNDVQGPSRIKTTTNNKKISVNNKQKNTMVLTIDRWENESEAAFNKRADSIMMGLNNLALVNGLTHIKLVTDENSKLLINNAIDEAEKIGSGIRSIEVEKHVVEKDEQDFKLIAVDQPWSK
jgi:hypothetical protein